MRWKIQASRKSEHNNSNTAGQIQYLCINQTIIGWPRYHINWLAERGVGSFKFCRSQFKLYLALTQPSQAFHQRQPCLIQRLRCYPQSINEHYILESHDKQLGQIFALDKKNDFQIQLQLVVHLEKQLSM